MKLTMWLQEKALLRATIEWCYKGTGMEGGELKLAEFKLPADRPEAENSYWPPDSKKIWWSDISGGAPDNPRALPLGGQEPFDILE